MATARPIEFPAGRGSRSKSQTAHAISATCSKSLRPVTRPAVTRRRRVGLQSLAKPLRKR
ncbi:hypothetical protein AWC32_08415 [Mycobacterium xenopi]|nr:hypothetical protein I552_4734 [Mycobacterium xenopi 3993]ORX19846.1 hypothetical protein AWC32_08415 [Mycobacterium xenopi]